MFARFITNGTAIGAIFHRVDPSCWFSIFTIVLAAAGYQISHEKTTSLDKLRGVSVFATLVSISWF